MNERSMVTVELYPWHSTAVTAPMQPDPRVIREWVLAPVRGLNAPVFAFGAAWLRLLPLIGLPEVDRLGVGGRPYPTAVPSRAVRVYDLDGIPVIAEKHAGSAGPPSSRETLALSEAVLIGP